MSSRIFGGDAAHWAGVKSGQVDGRDRAGKRLGRGISGLLSRARRGRECQVAKMAGRLRRHVITGSIVVDLGIP